jgi:hypothetical protein
MSCELTDSACHVNSLDLHDLPISFLHTWKFLWVICFFIHVGYVVEQDATLVNREGGHGSCDEPCHQLVDN